jgi:hypothetical protein
MKPSDYSKERAKIRQLDHTRLELMIAELLDMKTRHHSGYFKVRLNEAVDALTLAQSKLLRLNEQFEEIP